MQHRRMRAQKTRTTAVRGSLATKTQQSSALGLSWPAHPALPRRVTIFLGRRRWRPVDVKFASELGRQAFLRETYDIQYHEAPRTVGRHLHSNSYGVARTHNQAIHLHVAPGASLLGQRPRLKNADGTQPPIHANFHHSLAIAHSESERSNRNCSTLVPRSRSDHRDQKHRRRSCVPKRFVLSSKHSRRQFSGELGP